MSGVFRPRSQGTAHPQRLRARAGESEKLVNLGRYEILEELGRGAMGVVYKAHDPLLNRVVAIKTMSPDAAENEELRSRLEREAVLAAKLRHPNIVTVFDVGEEGGIPFMAMEFLEGIDLKHIPTQNIPLYPSEKWGVLRQVCLGLHHAHKEGVIHRDIKPGNIRILRDGTVKIMDFGIARFATSQLTQAGMVLGSANYMSPEQVEGHRVDHRSDIFSFGILAYELLSHRLPFKGENMSSTMFNILRASPSPLDLVDLKFPAAMNDIIVKCMQKKPEDRYQDTIEIVYDLDSLAGEIQDAVQSTVLPPLEERRSESPPSSTGEDPEATLLTQTEGKGTHSTVRLWVSPGRFDRISESIETKRPKRAPALAPGPRSALKAAAPTFARVAGPSRLSPQARVWAAISFALILTVGGVGLYWVSQSGTSGASAQLEKTLSLQVAAATEKLDAGDFLAAAEEFKKVLQVAPDHPEARAGLERAEREQQQHLSELIGRARELVGERRFQEAIPALEQAQKADPQNEEVRRLLGEAQGAVASSGQAQEAFARGVQAFERKDYAGAVKEFERALQFEPAHREARARLRSAQAELAKPRFGALTVNALPFGEVLLDGKSLGTTPVRVEKVTVGKHTLRVTREGYEDFERTVVVEEGQTQNFVAELVKKR
jgi:serine/threonine protein kinase